MDNSPIAYIGKDDVTIVKTVLVEYSCGCQIQLGCYYCDSYAEQVCQVHGARIKKITTIEEFIPKP